MKLLRIALLLGVVGGGGWFAYNHVSIDGLERLKLRFGGETSAESTPPVVNGDTIRIASFNIQVFGRSKLEKRDVMETLAKIVRRFDIVAVQEIRSVHSDIIPRFVAMINEHGRRYEYAVGPRLGRTSSNCGRSAARWMISIYTVGKHGVDNNNSVDNNYCHARVKPWALIRRILTPRISKSANRSPRSA